MAGINMNCPRCNRTDKVAKVSAIVRDGTVDTTPLERPSKPSSDLPSGGCLTLIGVILLLAGLAGLWGGKSSEQLLSVIFAIGGGLLCMKEISERSAAKRKFEEMLPRWEKADQRWNQLFYCGRDDTVFNPYDGTSMPIEDMNKYLYS